jgi:hypothetical protein
LINLKEPLKGVLNLLYPKSLVFNPPFNIPENSQPPTFQPPNPIPLTQIPFCKIDSDVKNTFLAQILRCKLKYKKYEFVPATAVITMYKGVNINSQIG